MTLKQLTQQLSQPTESTRHPTDGSSNQTIAARKDKKEDKYGLMDNMVIESLPPMREDGPRVFIIS